MFLLKCGADFEAFSHEITEHGVKGRKLTDNEIGFFHALKGFYDSHINLPDSAQDMADASDYEQGDD
jgi:hypothetical protein